MRIGRKVIIPAILALSTAGSILVGSAAAVAPAAAAQASSVHVLAAAKAPSVYYHE